MEKKLLMYYNIIIYHVNSVSHNYMYTVLHSLCTLLFVIEQGIISITLLSVLFRRSI